MEQNGKIHLVPSKNGSVELEGLTNIELVIIRGMIAGGQWVTIKDGRLRSRAMYERLPLPVPDKELLPFWSNPESEQSGKSQIQMEFFSQAQYQSHCPSFYIQGLHGHGYNPEEYRRQAATLESYGFECLRSRRTHDGGYSEIWYLPGLEHAQGALKETAPDPKSEKAVEDAVNFLSRNVSFGSLDVSVQRAAATPD